ncbi:unnamed protein product, partial [Rotaria sp. Silwood2]
FNIRDLFASYLTDIQSDERPNTSSINLTQLKSSTDDQYSNSYSILTLHSLLSFTSFYSSSVTFFFCSHIFDLQTATPSILHIIQFRYTLNRQYSHKKQKMLFVSLYRYSNE